MKKTFAVITGAVALLLAANTSSLMAKDKEKEVSITGEAKCAKCMLKEAGAKECQTVIEVDKRGSDKRGKTEEYYVVENDVSKAFHEDVCHAAKKVKATGTVSKSGGRKGKMELTLTKIEAVK
jgi:hypothetical protein